MIKAHRAGVLHGWFWKMESGEQVAKSLGSFWKLRAASKKWGPKSYNKRWDPSNNLEADSS